MLYQKKTNAMLRCTNRAVACKTHKIILQLCSVLVRAKQGHCVHFWTLVCTECGDMLEGGHRNETRII